MGQVSDFMHRVGDVAIKFIKTAGEMVAEMPVTCYRCHQESKYGEGKGNFYYSVPEQYSPMHFYCHDCHAAILAEYRFRCTECGHRHNIPGSSLCADCLILEYPREASRVAYHNKRAQNAALEGSLTLADWFKTIEDFDRRCWVCGAPFEALDHYVPFALGGGTTAQNCFPICKSCNSSKGMSDPDENVQELIQLLQPYLRIRQYQRVRWPQLPSGTAGPSADTQQLPPSDSTNTWSL